MSPKHAAPEPGAVDGSAPPPQLTKNQLTKNPAPTPVAADDDKLDGTVWRIAL